jgi:nuclear mRNA export protein SAC3
VVSSTEQLPANPGTAPTLPPELSVSKSAASDANPLFGAKPPAPIDRSKGYDALSKWITLGEDGLIDQFTAFQVEEILRQTMKSFMEQEAERTAQEADDRARIDADRFRYRSLATKYGYRWRELAQRLWMKRKGREARQARREMAESMRSSKAAKSANLVEEFKASTTNRQRESLESLLQATGVLNGVHNPQHEIRSIIRSEDPESSHKRQRSERSSTSIASTVNRHKRGKSENPLRRSLLSDPSYLNGDSRIHLMANYSAQEENRRQVSGVQTDYFRLKARGITTLSDGTPLANSAAQIIHQKRSFDGVEKSSTPQSIKHRLVARSVPAKFATQVQKVVNGNNREDLKELKIKAKAFVADEKKSRQKRAFTDDEEELFERAKRVREQMDEGAKWYRKEIERGTESRSVS